MQFKEWLDEYQFSEGRLSNVAGILALAAGTTGGGTYDRSYQPPQAQVKPDSAFVNAIQQKYRVPITPADVQLIRPIDVIKPMYGNRWDDAYDKNKDNLEIPVPVVFMNPTLFGDDGKGFCTYITVNGKPQKFCVVNSRADLVALRHELTHSTQDLSHKRLLFKGYTTFTPPDTYLSNELEIGVRLAEMKRNYFQLTGKIATRATVKEMIDHFLSNTKYYSRDVQQLMDVFRQADESGLLPILMGYFEDNIDKVVQNQPATKNPYV